MLFSYRGVHETCGDRVRMWVYVSAALIVLALFSPSALPIVKGALLILLAGFLLVRASVNDIAFDTGWMALVGAAALLLVGGVLLGLARGNTGVLEQGRVWALALPAWALFGALRMDERSARWMAGVVFWSFVVYILLLVTIRLMPWFGLLGEGEPIIWKHILGVSLAINTTRTIGSVHSDLLAILAFGIPYVLVYAFLHRRRHALISFFAITLGLVAIAISARKAFYISVPLAFAYVYLLRVSCGRLAGSSKRAKRAAWPLVAGLHILFPFALLVLLLASQPLGEQVQFVADRSTLTKIELSSCLLEEWSTVPLFGAGLGTVLEQCLRSESSPWSYELSYHMMLMNLGVVGFLVAGGVLTIGGFLVYKRLDVGQWLAAPAVAGLVGLLIAHATNPYIANMEDGWVFAFLGWMLHYRSSSGDGA